MSRLTQQLEELGVHVDTQLFELACTHRSYAYENGGIPSNERLEFLGDAVLQIVVTEHIFNTYPELAEGELAKLRASVVSTYALAKVARELELGGHILLGKGEVATGGNDKSSILADTTEAIIGAVHLSGGADASARFVHALLDERIAQSQADGEYADFKTSLQELAARNGWGLPVYEVVGTGPDHQRVFTATVVVDGQPRGAGTAPSKKLAEQRAATIAYRALGGTNA
ncbi:ribonuclease III [Tessaracoccus terricola]